MPAIRNDGAALRKRSPQHLQQQCVQADHSLDSAAASTLVSASAQKQPVGMLPLSAPLPGAFKGSGRWGAHRNRAAVVHKASKKTTVNKAGGSCAWPAYARSAAEAETEAVAAVISLYADELKPFGRILRKRVAERIFEGCGIVANIANMDALPDVDATQVRTVCEACELLQVDEEEGGDWSVVLLDRPPTFIDVHSPTDSYQEKLWTALQTYCESPAGRVMSLPGGRYACAQALKSLQLPFLADFSLGRISHIVQLAISQKKIFGYMCGTVVPYARSQSMMKDKCAMYGQPSRGRRNGRGNSSALTVASLEVVRKRLWEILVNANGEVSLSNVKRLFRSRFQLDLSETSLGHSKLSELLQDSKFSDICRIELRGHGYMVIQAGQKGGCMATALTDSFPVAGLSPAVPLLGTTDSRAPEDQDVLIQDDPCHATHRVDEPECLDDIDSFEEGDSLGDVFVSCSVQHTFLQYKVPQTPLPGPKRRSHSLPKDMGRSEWPVTSETCFVEDEPAPVLASTLLPKASDEDDITSHGLGFDGLRKLPSCKQTDSGGRFGLSNEEASSGYVPVLPSASAVLNDVLGTGQKEDPTSHVMPKDKEQKMPRVIFCPDEPLELDESDIF